MSVAAIPESDVAQVYHPRMDLNPRTIREVEFRERLRGYHPDDVDEFLERLAAGVETMQDMLREATERASRLEQERAHAPTQQDVVAPEAPVSPADDSIKRTLALAQRTADLAVSESRQEAARIVSAAEEAAQEAVAAAELRAREIVAAAEHGLREEIARLEEERNVLIAELGALGGYLEAERARLKQALTEALGRVDHVVPRIEPLPGTGATQASHATVT